MEIKDLNNFEELTVSETSKVVGGKKRKCILVASCAPPPPPSVVPVPGPVPVIPEL